MVAAIGSPAAANKVREACSDGENKVKDGFPFHADVHRTAALRNPIVRL
jgi:hypothetical protein